MEIQLSDHFDMKRLLKFTFPSIIMMIFTSIYSVVDGLFVSNFAGKEAFTAVNFVMPYLMIMSACGFMFGTGGSALVGMLLGMKREKEAEETFSLIVYATAISGLVLAAIGIFAMRSVVTFLGAEGTLRDNCILYGNIIMAATPFFMLQIEFQTFFVTAQKPKLGLFATLAGGITNIVLDFVLVGILQFGLVGAAAATFMSMFVGGMIPIFYFARPNSSLLRLGRTRFDGKALLQTCVNGSSELLSNISMSVVSALYNAQLIRYAGEDGVAAYGVLMYVSMIFVAIFLGYSMGSAPIVSYHYGAGNTDELHNLLKRSVILLAISSVSMFVASEVLAGPLSSVYVGYDADLLKMTKEGFFIFSFSFLFSGFAIYSSSFFTALNDGPTSALISFLRTIVFQVAAVLLLPLFLGITGIWLSLVVAEVLSVAVAAALLLMKRGKYRYF